VIQEALWDYHNPYEWLTRVRESSFPPLAVCVAITGGVQGKEANPNLPETAEEQVEQTLACHEAGASMVHLHVRDPQKWWGGSGEVAQYGKVHALIREACSDIITYEELRRIATAMQERDIKPEMEVYHPGQLWSVFELIELGLVEGPYLIQFVMGYGMSPWATPHNLVNFFEQLPSGCAVEVSGVGPFQLHMTTMAIIMGAQMVRVGMEDNVYYERGRLLESNAEAVARVVRIARELNREIATPQQTRQMLGLSPVPSQY
jgi:3-keto-5-aminohexanoate cleavage enzyme